jgi:hypothetical protein
VVTTEGEGGDKSSLEKNAPRIFCKSESPGELLGEKLLFIAAD